RSMIHNQGISIPGLKRLLALAPCWEVADCPAEVHEACEARVDKAPPRSMHVAGDEVSEKKAKAAEQATQKSGSGRDHKQAGRN
ncbi:MAG TPA: hypothetical protein VLL73_08165, partial [Desulfurivibrionaceae bacterium]|nr:hypothetical protein [Desulfurivibrionaceae bacterium]